MTRMMWQAVATIAVALAIHAAVDAVSVGPLPEVAKPVLAQAPQCSGHGDTSSGCPADPAPWVCSLEGKGGAHKCACKQVCGFDEDGNRTTGESNVCGRYCTRDKCVCHVEEECPDGNGNSH